MDPAPSYQLHLILGRANLTAQPGVMAMANIVVIGAGLGGMSAAFELRETLGRGHAVTVVGEGPRFAFTPSNHWLAVGWRTPEQTSLDAGESLAPKDIGFNGQGAIRIAGQERPVHDGDGPAPDTDYQ